MFKSSMILVLLFSAHAAIADPPIDVTESVIHLQCRAWGRDHDPYYFETMKSPRNPGDPTSELLLVWSYNSILNSRPICYFNISSVNYFVDGKKYCVVFDERRGNLCFVNGGGGFAEFQNSRGGLVQEELSSCLIEGKW